MNIFISHRGTIGWTNRKVMDCYDLPFDFDFATDLVRSGIFASLRGQVLLAPGVILDVKAKAACSGVPAIALFPLPDRFTNANLADVVSSYVQYLADLYARRPRLENAVFAKMPLVGGLLQPDQLPASTLLPGVVVQSSRSADIFSTVPTGAHCQVSLKFSVQNLADTEEVKSTGNSEPFVAGLLLSFEDALINPKSSPTRSPRDLIVGPVVPGKLVLYPEVEKDHGFKWQSWLRNVIDYYGCFKHRRKRSVGVTGLQTDPNRRPFRRRKAFAFDGVHPGSDRSLLDLFRGERSSPPILGPDQVTRLDEVLFMRESGYLPGPVEDPPPGSLLSLYRGLSEPVAPPCTCPSSAKDANDEDRKVGSSRS
jgi:hypothetical protein